MLPTDRGDLSANTGGRFEDLLFKYDISEDTVSPYIANITVADKWLFGLPDLPYTHSQYGEELVTSLSMKC